MNDSDRLYQSIQQRLLQDRLIGRSVAAHIERREETDFQFWQVETEWPQAVNLAVQRIGEMK